MLTADWLRPELILTDAPAADLAAVLDLAVDKLAEHTGIERARLSRALEEGSRVGHFGVVQGIAIHHGELEGLPASRVALVLTRDPIAIDQLERGRRSSVFFVALFRPDNPKGQLLLLAHLARLAQSRVLLDALGGATTSDEALALVRAAELQHEGRERVSSPPEAAERYLAMITVSGEQAVDALLVQLIDEDFEDASILEVQGLEEVAAREIPLFAGFRDLFGDPGGRRVLLLDIPGQRMEALSSLVRRVFDERKPRDGSISFVPVHGHWRWARPAKAPERSSGH